MSVDIGSIELSPEQKKRLAELADRTGRSWSDVFDQCVHREALESEERSITESSEEYIEDPKHWRARFDDWVGRQRTRNPNVDDSRQSIYPDRSS